MAACYITSLAGAPTSTSPPTISSTTEPYPFLIAVQPLRHHGLRIRRLEAELYPGADDGSAQQGGHRDGQ